MTPEEYCSLRDDKAGNHERDQWQKRIKKDGVFKSKHSPYDCLEDYKAGFDAAYAYVQALEEQVKQLEDALKGLVVLKNYKTKHGKDDFYEMSQPIAWEDAKAALGGEWAE